MGSTATQCLAPVPRETPYEERKIRLPLSGKAPEAATSSADQILPEDTTKQTCRTLRNGLRSCRRAMQSLHVDTLPRRQQIEVGRSKGSAAIVARTRGPFVDGVARWFENLDVGLSPKYQLLFHLQSIGFPPPCVPAIRALERATQRCQNRYSCFSSARSEQGLPHLAPLSRRH